MTVRIKTSPMLFALSAGLGAVVALMSGVGRSESMFESRAGGSPNGVGTGGGSSSIGDDSGRGTRSPPLRFRGSSGAADHGPTEDALPTTDPTSTGYDPSALATRLGMRPLDIFNKEPRMADFAERREEVLRKAVDDRLRRGGLDDVDVAVECRTSSCELTLSGPEGGNLSDALHVIDLRTLGAEAAEVGFGRPGEGRRGLRAILLFSPALRDHQAFDELLRARGATDEATRHEP